MTEPTPPPPSTSVDPITAILLSVTRIEGNLAGALDTLKRHDGELSTIKTTQAEHGNRLTALETRGQTDDQHHERSLSEKVAFWTAGSTLVLLVTLLVTLWVQHR